MISESRLPGISFITRCHNEEQNIEKAITSLRSLTIPYDITVILHRCTDNSESLVSNLLVDDPIQIVKYNEPISRAGYETLITPSDHKNSLITYVNWCFNHAKRNWIFRWDADFTANKDLISFLNQLNPEEKSPFIYKIKCDLGDHITAEHYLSNCTKGFKKYKFWEVAEYSVPNATFAWPPNDCVIQSVPRNNLKKYWNNTAWFRQPGTENIDLASKLFLLEFLAGNEPRGFGACCYRVDDFYDLFVKIDQLEHNLNSAGIDFYR